ncbi:hypothetical protein [Pedobacter sp. KBS0701]|uniref:hypothetical protein n=1 Tax=unclassified Pedobacter TaxID=2628915 RepID=UPI00110F17CA|nr:hypothetical protein [Pedobacter sp. KBS0701]QDW23741.1 hypothetical protein FFJ24_002440 [Pedobacter sp. KBS0701]
MRFIVYLFVFCFSYLNVQAQNYLGITPMHKFFQKHADSTYIISSANQYHIEYQILSKVGDTISTYTYKSNTKLGPKLKEIPRAFREAFLKKNANLIYFIPVDINVFFQPKYLNLDSLKQFWTKSAKLKMWSVSDDKIDGEGCDLKQPGYAISDGGQIYLHLITKDNIKELFFYAPDYYNEKCPGRKGRKAILELSDLFNSYFKEK